MEYNQLYDLLTMGALITVLVAFIKLAGRSKRGATKMKSRVDIIRHQHRRRIWMAANGGLPIEMGRIEI